MSNDYHSLTFSKISKTSGLIETAHMKESSVLDGDPAIVVMTDFKRIIPLCIEATATIDNANGKMILCGVRLLFVTDDNDVVIGLITANDILGEEPVNYIREHGGQRSDIIVLDIMTRNSEIDAVRVEDVVRMKVGDIVETLKACERHHILITEQTDEGLRVRGMFSRTQVSRQTGVEIKFSNRASTFAELEHALVASG